jgi:3-hydroxybutyryl-CoA dehydrogenase
MSDGLRVVVVGAGLMGSQIGCEYALGGHEVTFLVRDELASRRRVDAALALAEGAGLVDVGEAAAAREGMSFVTGAQAVPANAELVVESIPEDLELKRTVLGELAGRLPNAIIASNTSSIPLSELGEAIGAPERTLGTHYWNPPLLMPPVEIIRGGRTSPEPVETVRRVIEGLGKEVLLVERDVAGFIWNRLQLALLRESLWLVENGVASPETVDRTVRSGLARRSRFTGPFETVALGGPDSWARVAANLFPVLSNASEAGDLGRWLRRSPEELSAIRAERDRGLASELGRTSERPD